MADFVYNEAKRAFASGEINLTSDDIRIALVMTNTTADTEDDVNLMNGFSTLDECDDASYARQALANEAVNEDATNNRAEFDADDDAFTLAGDGTRDIQGMIVYKHVTNDTDSVPIAWIDSGGFPVAKEQTGTLSIQWNAEGILQFA